MRKCELCQTEFKPKSNRQIFCEECSKLRIQAYDRERKSKQSLKQKLNDSSDTIRIITQINRGSTAWRNPIEPKTDLCKTIQSKLESGQRLEKSELSHVGACDSCSYAYRYFGYGNSELGIDSMW